MTATLLFLGTGGSMGIPVIGCDCAVCLSDKQVNKRSRPSALIQWERKNILIDCGPDFRCQALHYGIKDLDGVILTHAHNDHMGGFDELRVFYFRHKKPLPCLFSKETEEGVRKRFGYIFEAKGAYQQFMPKFEITYLDGASGDKTFLGLPVHYISYEQADMKVNGLRFGSLAYVTDIRNYEPSIFEHLQGLDTLILSALRFTPSPLHFDVDEAVEFSRKVGAKMTYLTHIAHELEHEHTNAYLPANVRLAYDGLQLTFKPYD